MPEAGTWRTAPRRWLAGAFDFLLGGPRVGGALADRLAAWARRPRPPEARRHVEARYVVLDTETTGLDLARDRLIALGAVALERGRVSLGDAFVAVLRQHMASAEANILIHGIGGTAQRTGREPAEALIAFLEFVGKDPLVAWRADFDRAVVVRACRDFLGIDPRLAWIDLAWLMPALFRGTPCDSLDDWLAHFGIDSAARHDAAGDAWATAQLALVAFDAAARAGMRTTRDLVAMQKAQAWLGTRR
ncbi:MAG TPA: 3'-5' exonuclease [Casimicrobiaceae bacterium]|nr:3'-5' exonuclease [Casimicrobiaceae bacterium]